MVDILYILKLYHVCYLAIMWLSALLYLGHALKSLLEWEDLVIARKTKILRKLIPIRIFILLIIFYHVTSACEHRFNNSFSENVNDLVHGFEAKLKDEAGKMVDSFNFIASIATLMSVIEIVIKLSSFARLQSQELLIPHKTFAHSHFVR